MRVGPLAPEPCVLVEPVRRTGYRWILLARHESFFQGGEELVVARARFPHHPTIIAGIVDRALLLFELVRAVGRLAERECLEPGANVLALDTELLVTLARPRDRDVNHVVRRRIGMWQLEGARWIVRRIHHWQHDVDVWGNVLPLLANFERAAHCRNASEDVGGGPHAHFCKPGARGLQEFGEHLLLGASVL